jgi:hypothetical protein
MLMVIAGITGLILPVIPGWIWLIPGLMLLAREFVWAQRLLDWLKARLPERLSPSKASATATNLEQSDSSCREK